jgi:hypothetical protein
MLKKSGKSVPWGAHEEDLAGYHGIPPMVIRAMEKMHMREKMTIEQVASTFRQDPEIVRSAIAMRRNFEAVWHEALHFLQPAENPFLGNVTVSVEAPAGNKVKCADERGYIGAVRISLELDTEGATTEGEQNLPYRRRIRKVLKRQTKKGHSASNGDKSEDVHLFSQGNFSKSGTKGEEANDAGDDSSGVVIEFLIELRKLSRAECVLDEGQSVRSKEELIKTKGNPGIHMTAVGAQRSTRTESAKSGKEHLELKIRKTGNTENMENRASEN